MLTVAIFGLFGEVDYFTSFSAIFVPWEMNCMCLLCSDGSSSAGEAALLECWLLARSSRMWYRLWTCGSDTCSRRPSTISSSSSQFRPGENKKQREVQLNVQDSSFKSAVSNCSSWANKLNLVKVFLVCFLVEMHRSNVDICISPDIVIKF